MSSAVASTRVRKACLPCIRAKAKCSPSEHRPNECYRCIRLNKDCVFEVLAKKPGPGPKSRSRVRQLEQRVESLIGFITAKTSDGSLSTSENPLPVQVPTPDSTTPTETVPHASPQDHVTRYWTEAEPFQAYDPVDAGMIDEQHAYRLVQEFQTSFIWAFPFVVVDVDAPTLRQCEPFLFHAILTVVAYDTPPVQHKLSEQLRHEIGRVVEQSRKSLGTLQGLLVYGGWYHGFYHPANQQLTTIVQLCVALVQDLGLSNSTKAKQGRFSVAECCMLNRPQGSLAEKRAFLGTCFLTAAFNQAWRKRTTLSYSRFVTQCCEAFEGSNIPTDCLISPLIKASELLSRVNDHFSYSDIDNAEIKGEVLIEMSTTSFLAELKHIRDSTLNNPLLRENTSLTLITTLLDIGINEACLHSSLWTTSSHPATGSRSLLRLKLLHRAMEGAIAYIRTILEVPQHQLYRLGLGTWSAWFYSFVVICKLVFLQENERIGETAVDDLPGEIDNLMPHNLAPENLAAQDPTGHVASIAGELDWSALTVVKQYDLCDLFGEFSKHMAFTLPEKSVPWQQSKAERDSMYAIACLHYTMHQGFTKRIDRLSPGETVNTSTGQPVTESFAPTQNYTPTASWQPSQQHGGANIPPVGSTGALPFASFMNFDSINFDGIALPTSTFQSQGGEQVLGDWMWNMVMDDFTMPTL